MDRDLDAQGNVVSDWMLLSRERTILDSEQVKAITVPIATMPEWRPWTDDHVDLLRVLR
jgi:hypothetical protein